MRLQLNLTVEITNLKNKPDEDVQEEIRFEVQQAIEQYIEDDLDDEGASTEVTIN